MSCASAQRFLNAGERLRCSECGKMVEGGKGESGGAVIITVWPDGYSSRILCLECDEEGGRD